MPTELDQQFEGIMAAMTQPGAPFETAPFERFGTTLPAFKNAPPSLAHYFAHYCNEHRDAPFLVDGDIRLTFGETYAAARHAAAGLIQRHAVRPGDRIGIAARNSANWIVAYMGAVMAGGVATLVNGFWNGKELTEGIRLAECSLVLADDQRIERLEGEDHGATLLELAHDVAPEEGLASIWPERGVGDITLPDLGRTIARRSSTPAARPGCRRARCRTIAGSSTAR